MNGQHWDQEVWLWRDRAQSIILRELKAIRRFLMGSMGQIIEKKDLKSVLLHVDNQAVVQITNAFVSSSRLVMAELRRLKKELDFKGLYLKAEWLQSVSNRFADALSRRFHCGDQ